MRCERFVASARVLVRLVVQPPRDFEHSRARLGVDERVVVDGARDGHLRDAKLARDVGQSYGHELLLGAEASNASYIDSRPCAIDV
jgi:hypothetical protein